MTHKENIDPSFIRRVALFLKSKRFRVHFVISLALGALIIWFAFKSLGSYTHHGITISVPDFSGVATGDLDRFIADKQLRYQVIDSVYDTDTKGGVVLRQDPEKNSAVKANRTIYLTVSSKLPPLVKMPNLVDASMRQALAVLESFGLKAGRRDYRPDPCVNCVLAQTMKGKTIRPGEMIPKGSVIDLVLGEGQEGDKISIPCLTGLSRKEAAEKIAESGFAEGSVVCGECKTKADQDKGKVYKQDPPCSAETMVRPGTPIDLYIGIKQKTEVKDEE